MPGTKTQRFLATIYTIWILRHVDVPEEAARALAKQMQRGGASKTGKQAMPKYIPVVAIVNRCRARATLVPAGAGRYRMQINTALRKAAGADVGDIVSVELRLDRASRALPVPTDLRAGLQDHPKVWKAFQALTPGHRRHVIQWFDSAKSAAARSRRLDRVIDHLLERTLLSPRR